MVLFSLHADSAVVYLNGFNLYWSLDVKGRERVEVLGIPSEAVNVRVSSGVGQVLKHTLRDTTLPWNPHLYDSLLSQKRALRKALSRLEARKKQLSYENDLINSYVKKDVRLPPRTLLSLSSRLYANSVILDSLEEEIESLKEELSKVDGKLKEVIVRTKALEVVFDRKIRGRVNLRYTLPRGGWIPKYVFRTSLREDKVSLEVFSTLINRSSSPLRAKRVVIVGNLYSPGGKPRHSRWVLRERPRPAPPPSRTFMEKMPLQAPLESGATGQHVRPVMTFLTTRYEYSEGIDIPPWDKAQIRLLKREYRAGFITEIYPEVEEKAYISAVFTPDLDLPPGESEVYLEGEMVSTFGYAGAQRGAEDTLFVGFDPFVRGELSLISQRRKVKGRGKDRWVVESRTHEVRVKNKRGKSVKVRVYVRKPFTEGKVELRKVSFKPKPHGEGEEGLVFWDVELKPGGEFKVSREVEIRYPFGLYVFW